MIKLKYGNTNSFYFNGLLIDTDYAGTLNAFYKAIKKSGIESKDIRFVLATHYHPDHMGIIGELEKQGVRLILMDVQKDSIHASDYIFKRVFLAKLGISGEIIHTPSHSPDSISLVLDSGDCFVGDLEPFEYLQAYDDNEQLKADWKHIFSLHPKRIFFAHSPERNV